MLALSLSAALFATVAVSKIGAHAHAQSMPPDASPVFGATLPPGYRDWKVITVAREAGTNNDIRAVLGNDIAVNAFRKGKRPFPDGTVIVRLAWEYQSSPRNDAVFPLPQSFVAGPPTDVQVSVKDSKKYAASQGWGYGQFENGRANQSAALVQKCLACHTKLEKGDDLVFSHWSP
jgi:hypothetical protein